MPLPDYSSLLTEAAHPRARRLDTLPPIEVVSLMLAEEMRVARAVAREKASIAAAAARITGAFRAGGRLIYVGAGTSGRLGVLDAAECAPTFSVPRTWVVGIIAGGPSAIQRAVEGAEDDPLQAERQLRASRVGPRDVVCAIAASGVTPFALAALAFARSCRAQTVFVTCAPPPHARALADEVIAPRVGPEVLAGSTRLKAGTATKLVLNALSTTAMVGLGKVYGHRMVDVRPTNAKLRARAARMLCDICGVDEAAARCLLRRSGDSVKVAVVMHARGVTRARARALLSAQGGRLRDVLERAAAAPARDRSPARRASG